MMLYLFALLPCLIVFWTLAFIVGVVALRMHLQRIKAASKKENDNVVVGLFHPYCNAGGGGERVLWCAIRAMHTRYPNAHYVVYTGDIDAAPEEILSKAKKRFSIEFQSNITFIYLHGRKWVEANQYPYFTLLGQSLGSVYLGIEALHKVVPDIYIDTMGYAFTLPLFKFLGDAKVGCYIHYPTISTDMLRRVYSRVEAHNNRGFIARSPFFTSAKSIYYRLFARLYGWVGRCSDIIMVNSSWTEDHINNIWKVADRTYKVYPPCYTEEFKKVPLSDDADKDIVNIVSIAQFRPEKNHQLQIRTMYELRQLIPEAQWENVRLVLIGSCRNDEDKVRVKDMQDLSKHYSVEDNVVFKINLPFDKLKEECKKGVIGIHSMWNEHFGIGVVECMASGLVMIANKSGGPMMDIVVEDDGSRNGFLARDEREYALIIRYILNMKPEDRLSLKEKARASVDRFSDHEFQKSFLRSVEPLFR